MRLKVLPSSKLHVLRLSYARLLSKHGTLDIARNIKWSQLLISASLNICLKLQLQTTSNKFRQFLVKKLTFFSWNTNCWFNQLKSVCTSLAHWSLPPVKKPLWLPCGPVKWLGMCSRVSLTSQIWAEQWALHSSLSPRPGLARPTQSRALRPGCGLQ